MDNQTIQMLAKNRILNYALDCQLLWQIYELTNGEQFSWLDVQYFFEQGKFTHARTTVSAAFYRARQAGFLIPTGELVRVRRSGGRGGKFSGVYKWDENLVEELKKAKDAHTLHPQKSKKNQIEDWPPLPPIDKKIIPKLRGEELARAAMLGQVKPIEVRYIIECSKQ